MKTNVSPCRMFVPYMYFGKFGEFGEFGTPSHFTRFSYVKICKRFDFIECGFNSFLLSSAYWCITMSTLSTSALLKPFLPIPCSFNTRVHTLLYKG